MVNPYAGFGNQSYPTSFGMMSPEAQQWNARMQALGQMGMFPQQFPMGGTYTPAQSQGFGMQGMLQMMLLLMQLLQKKQTPTTIDGAKGQIPDDIAGAYGRNAAINFMNTGVPDGVSVKYTDDPNNLDNLFAFTRQMVAIDDLNGDGNVTADEHLAKGVTPESAGKRMETFDRNRDGVIDLAENAAQLLSRDTNHDGVISAEEYTAAVKLMKEHPDQAKAAIDKALADYKLEEAADKFGQNLIFSTESHGFNATDKNDDGFITAEEQLAYFKSQGQFGYTLDQAKKDIAANDVDGDGKNSLLENVGTRVSWDSNKDWILSRGELVSGIITERTGSADYVIELTKKAIEERGLTDLLKAWQEANKSA